MNPLPPEYEAFCRLWAADEYFEAHEVLEDLWREDRSGFFKGLIHAAVAFVHLQRGNAWGARRCFRTAGEYLRTYRPRHLGLDVERLIAELRRCHDRVDRLFPPGDRHYRPPPEAARELFGRLRFPLPRGT